MYSMTHRRTYKLKLPSRTLALGDHTLVLGVLNVTPDSFSNGGQFCDPSAAVVQALAIERAGADILEIGGESVRPGAAPISANEEMARVLPVLTALRGRLKIPISIDTQKARVAEAAVAAGAEILNDISALRHDSALGELARRRRLPLILMHMRGTPRTMQRRAFARHVLRDVTRGLRAAVTRARRAGVPRRQIVLDPGFGFGKSFEQNYELLARFPELARLGFPLLVGTSRKTFIGHTLGDAPPSERLWGTAATVAAAILGGAHIVRVHDVEEMVQVARVTDCVLNAERRHRS